MATALRFPSLPLIHTCVRVRLVCCMSSCFWSSVGYGRALCSKSQFTNKLVTCLGRLARRFLGLGCVGSSMTRMKGLPSWPSPEPLLLRLANVWE